MSRSLYIATIFILIAIYIFSESRVVNQIVILGINVAASLRVLEITREILCEILQVSNNR